MYVLCTNSKTLFYGPTVFLLKTVNGKSLLGIWLLLRLGDDFNDYVFRQDGAPDQWGLATYVTF